jgi:excisionase family DNA binding protein
VTWQHQHHRHDRNTQQLTLQRHADLGQRSPGSLFREFRLFRVKLINSDPMKTARKPTEATLRSAPSALSIDIDPLVEVVRRHVKLTPQTTRLIKGEFAQLFKGATISGSARKATEANPATDAVLTTQEAADLVGVSRPYIVARVEAGDIPLHQQVGNQRRVLKSAVMAWNRQDQARRRKALGQLGADLDSEIFAG